MKIDESVQKYIHNFISSYPLTNSIWLFGSRANNSYKDDSDWDLLIFADKNILEALKRNNSFNQTGINILVVFDGKYFEGPWPDKKGSKKGDLISWKWTKTLDNEAVYRSVKYKNEDEWFKADNLESKTLKAIKIWSKQ
jgi:hypothetical protein